MSDIDITKYVEPIIKIVKESPIIGIPILFVLLTVFYYDKSIWDIPVWPYLLTITVVITLLFSIVFIIWYIKRNYFSEEERAFGKLEEIYKWQIVEKNNIIQECKDDLDKSRVHYNTLLQRNTEMATYNSKYASESEEWTPT